VYNSGIKQWHMRQQAAATLVRSIRKRRRRRRRRRRRSSSSSRPSSTANRGKGRSFRGVQKNQTLSLPIITRQT
jgi:hypothetical protein